MAKRGKIGMRVGSTHCRQNDAAQKTCEADVVTRKSGVGSVLGNTRANVHPPLARARPTRHRST